jgi:NADH-quinone oxidoreductase subunit G
MARVLIDGRAYDVDGTRNMLEVALGRGIDLPFFCWHPALGSVGACRQCAVKQFKDEDDDKGKLVMACMTPASEGTRISVEDAEARAFRAGVNEWLMVNHPHDCPVCDEGGECHLQDMTVMTGHRDRRFRFPKRTHRNQDLGPLVNHEMNRCIQCYRCVRFYKDYSGGRDFGAFGAHDHVYFGRHEDGVLESPFAGNLVEVCPTGVFTDKTLKEHYTRKWDLQTAPSVCVHCGLGCNITPGERKGLLRRVRARYNGHVNGHFLCDRGRYGYAFVNHERRLRHPLLPEGRDAAARAISPDEALGHAGPLLVGDGVVGIGSPRASLESNAALRTLVGEDRFYRGVSATEDALVTRVLDVLRQGPARTPPLGEVEHCDAVLVLGEDVTSTAPMLALALRQAARRGPLAGVARQNIPRWHDAAVREALQGATGPFFVATPDATALDDLATSAVRAAPEDVARLGFAVAHALDARAPRPDDLDLETERRAETLAEALATAERPLVVSGTGCASVEVIEAAAQVSRAAAARRDGAPAEIVFAVPECNSLGLALLGGQPLEAAFDAAEGGSIETAVVLENDLFRRAGRDAVERLLASVPHVIVVDHVAHETGARAELCLPAATFAEAEGTYVNNEGRAQRAHRVFVAEGDVRQAWRWLGGLWASSGRGDDPWPRVDDVRATMVEAVPLLERIQSLASSPERSLPEAPIPRQPHRWSGRTALHADETLTEPRPPADPDSPYSFSMEGDPSRPPAPLAPEFWAPGWNSVQSLHRFQEEVWGPLRGGDPGVRLLEPADSGVPRWFSGIPGAFVARDQEWRLVPLHHVFGEEELSALSPAVAALTPAPCLALGPEDAERLGLGEGDEVEVEARGIAQRLPLRIEEALPRGVAGLPTGLPGLAGPRAARWARVRRP